MADDAQAPSRSYLKAEEAYLVLGQEPAAGETVVEQGEIRSTPQGNILHVNREYDRDVEPDIQKWFEDNYSVSWRNYGVDNPAAASAAT